MVTLTQPQIDLLRGKYDGATRSDYLTLCLWCYLRKSDGRITEAGRAALARVG